MPTLVPSRTLLLLRGELRRIGCRCCPTAPQIASRTYTLDRSPQRSTPTTTNAPIPNPSPYPPMETAAVASVSSAMVKSSTYILDPSWTSAPQLTNQLGSLSQYQHSQRYCLDPSDLSSLQYDFSGERWLTIAGVGGLSFCGLMWLGESEILENRKQRFEATTNGDVVVAANVKPTNKIKAEWFRPFWETATQAKIIALHIVTFHHQVTHTPLTRWIEFARIPLYTDESTTFEGHGCWTTPLDLAFTKHLVNTQV